MVQGEPTVRQLIIERGVSTVACTDYLLTSKALDDTCDALDLILVPGQPWLLPY